MILYAKTKKEFIKDINKGKFISELKEEYIEKVGEISDGELRAWENSVCRYMNKILMSSLIDDDIGVAIEYQVPGTAERIDMVLSGTNQSKKDVIVIIELKQWTKISECEDEFGYVVLEAGGIQDIRIHPSYQAYSYKKWMELSILEENRINLDIHSLGYLHNYLPNGEDDAIYAKIYRKHLEDTPLFFKNEEEKLIEKIASLITQGDKGKGIYNLEKICVGSSKALQDVIENQLNGNVEFILSEQQMRVFKTIEMTVKKASTTKTKKVIIVKGGPGTGKSVVATYAMARIYANYSTYGIRCYYLSKNNAPRKVYCEKLSKGEDTRIFKELFKDTGFFANPRNSSFLTVVDESHRITAETKYAHTPEAKKNQIHNIIDSSIVSVFFIDENQVVSLEDAGSIREIQDYCLNNGYECINNFDLKSQFRCSGSDTYLKWLDNLLEIREEKYKIPKLDYDISISNSFEEFYEEMKMSNTNNNARIVAGYCWEWKSKNDISGKVMDFTLEGIPLRWNNYSGIWALDMNAFQQVGCVHTCQGLEFDYVGVIIGEDIVFRDGKIVTDYKKRSSDDFTLNEKSRKQYALKNGWDLTDKMTDKIIRNTYRILLTRGIKGCKIYCIDLELRNYLSSEISKIRKVN